MKELTIEEFEKKGYRGASPFVNDIISVAKDMFAENDKLKVLKITAEDLPEDQRYRLESRPELQKLASLLRSRRTPFDVFSVAVRRDGIYLVRMEKNRK